MLMQHLIGHRPSAVVAILLRSCLLKGLDNGRSIAMDVLMRKRWSSIPGLPAAAGLRLRMSWMELVLQM